MRNKKRSYPDPHEPIYYDEWLRKVRVGDVIFHMKIIHFVCERDRKHNYWRFESTIHIGDTL